MTIIHCVSHPYELVVLDLETTSRSAQYGRVMEVAAVRIMQDGTEKKHEHEIVPQLTAADAGKRW